MCTSVGCIYLITNTITNRQYVGRTKFPTPERRYKQHQSAAMRNNKTPLYRGMRKYGTENFKIEILCTASLESLDNMEAYWAEQLETYIWDCPLFHPRGYNAYWCGLYSYPKDRKREVSAYTRSLISAIHKGKKKPPHVIAAMNAKRRHVWKGRKHTPGTCAKIGAVHRGKKLSDAHKKRLVEAHTGRKLDIAHVSKARDNRIESVIENGAKGVKLTKPHVLEIVASAKAGTPYTEIANIYDVAISVISRIMSGERWGYITGIVKKETKSRGHKSLGIELATKIREQYATGNYSYNTLAVEYSVSKSTIHNIIKGKLYPLQL